MARRQPLKLAVVRIPDCSLGRFNGFIVDSLVAGAVDTLRRHGARSMGEDESFVRAHWHGVPFEPDAYVRVVDAIHVATPVVTVRGILTGSTNATWTADDAVDQTNC